MSSWFVSTSGSDSAGGSLAAPWRTVQHAVDAAASGDVINLRGGTYNEAVSIDKANLTIQSYTGERATIATSAFDASKVATIDLGQDAWGVKLLNLDLSGGYYYTLKTESNWDTGAAGEYGTSNLLIQGTTLHDSGRDVIKFVPGSNHITIRGSEIYNSGRRDPSNAEGIDAVNSNYSTVEDSSIHDVTTNGIYYKGGSVGTLIQRNRIYNIAYSGVILGQLSDDNWFDNATNPLHYESIDGVVRNNIISNAKGAGVAAWAALRPSFYNNTLLNVGQTMFGGFVITGEWHYIPNETLTPSKDVTFSNNIVVATGSRPAVDIRDGGLVGTLTMSNNRYYQNGNTPQFWDERGGYFQGDLTAWQSRLGTDAGSSSGDPGVDTSGHLLTSSAVINKGATISSVTEDYDKQVRPAAGAYDIGADEYGGTASTPTDPTPPPTTPPTTTPTPSVWENHSIASQTGSFVAEFDAKPTQNQSDILIGLSNGAASSATALAAIVRFNDTGTIDARNGGAYAAQNSVAYAAGTSYHFKLAVNMVTHTYDVYVTAAGKGQVLIGQGYAFRTEQAGVTSLNNWAKYNFSGDAPVSNFAVSAVATPTPVATPTWQNQSFSSQSGTFAVDFDAKPTQNNEDVVVGLSNGPASSYSNLAVAVRFNDSGTIDARNGGAYAAQNSVAYTAAASYHFRLVVRLSTHTYDVYVTTAGKSPILMGQNFAFRTEQAGVTSLNNWAKYNYTGNAAVGNFALSPVVSAAPTWKNQRMTKQTGNFSVDFDATPLRNNEDVVLGLSNGTASACTDLAVIVRFNDSGTIDARNGGVYAAMNSVAYTAGTSYHFKLVVHVSTHTYDVYVTPAGKSPILIAQNFAFRTEQAGVTSLNNWAKYNYTGDATISNMAVKLLA